MCRILLRALVAFSGPTPRVRAPVRMASVAVGRRGFIGEPVACLADLLLVGHDGFGVYTRASAYEYVIEREREISIYVYIYRENEREREREREMFLAYSRQARANVRAVVPSL